MTASASRAANVSQKYQGVGMDRGFEERKKKHEEKWALDEELRFKTKARSNKLFGRWAAGEMGLSGDDAEAYARTVVASELQAPGADAAFRKVRDDLSAAGITLPETEIHAKIAELAETARQQILNDRV
jgi:hypothetical protein